MPGNNQWLYLGRRFGTAVTKLHDYTVRLATSAEDVAAAQRLRYQVFVEELGASGPLVDHQAQLERDRFDDHSDHLILWHNDLAVGVYRLMTARQADAAGGFYTANEFELQPLLDSGRTLLEVGRSCLAADHRGGVGMLLLWSALAQHVTATKTDVLFGTASLRGANPADHAQALALLHQSHLAPPALRPTAKPPCVVADPAVQVDRKQAMARMPALIKAYLRLGGGVGHGAFVDQDFNTTDVCLVLDVENMSPLQKSIYTRGPTP